jgi:hypothetical protein
MTQGDATFTMAFSHHQPVGDALQQKMTESKAW